MEVNYIIGPIKCQKRVDMSNFKFILRAGCIYCHLTENVAQKELKTAQNLVLVVYLIKF